MKNSPAKRLKNSIKLGDIFSLGAHRLLCGDAQNSDLVSKLIGNDKIKIILADPPYSTMCVESKQFLSPNSRHKAIINDHAQSEEEYRVFTRKWLEVVTPFLSRKNASYIFNSDKMLFALREGMKDAGFYFAQLLIWVKTQAVIGRLDYLPQHELVIYGWHGTHEFMKSKDKSVLVCPRPSKSKLHPTMKPVSLLRRLILNSTKIGDTVYDPFSGSGSVMVACENTKRRCLMVELDLNYCQTIINRFEKLTGIKACKINPINHD